jgi:tetratricopeptide (TPR) repeat protein
MNETQWLPALFVLAVGFALAGIYLLLGRRGGAARPDAPAASAPVAPAGAPGAALAEGQLERERRAQTLLDELRALKQSRHQLAPEEYQAQVARLEREAAAALRARDEGRSAGLAAASPGAASPGASSPGAPLAAGAPGAAPGLAFFDRHPQLKGAVWGGGVVLFFVALGLVLGQESKPRDEGGALTGRTPPSSLPPGAGPEAGKPPPSPEYAQAMQRLESNPGDLEAAALVTHELIQRGDLEEAQRRVDRGLAVDPFHTELRVHREVLRALRQEMDAARAELQRLVELYPDAQEALLFLAGMEMQARNPPAALAHLERFLVSVPKREAVPAQVLAAVAQLREQVRGGDVPPPAAAGGK